MARAVVVKTIHILTLTNHKNIMMSRYVFFHRQRIPVLFKDGKRYRCFYSSRDGERYMRAMGGEEIAPHEEEWNVGDCRVWLADISKLTNAKRKTN